MYLRKLSIKHLKRIADLSLDFEHEGTPRMWTVLIGENGTAKTTILQAIALAAAGGRQVNTLARPYREASAGSAERRRYERRGTLCVHARAQAGQRRALLVADLVLDESVVLLPSLQ